MTGIYNSIKGGFIMKIKRILAGILSVGFVFLSSVSSVSAEAKLLGTDESGNEIWGGIYDELLGFDENCDPIIKTVYPDGLLEIPEDSPADIMDPAENDESNSLELFEKLIEMSDEEIMNISEEYKSALQLVLTSPIFFEQCLYDLHFTDESKYRDSNALIIKDIVADDLGIPAELIKFILGPSKSNINGKDYSTIRLSIQPEGYKDNSVYDTVKTIELILRTNKSISLFSIERSGKAYDKDVFLKDADYGDVNADGNVDLSDLTMMSQYTLKDIELTANQIKCADVNADDEVNLQDLALLKQYVMNDDVKLGVSENISSEDTKKDIISSENAEMIWLGYYNTGIDHDALNGEISSAVLRSMSDLSEYLSAAEKYPVIGSSLEKYDEKFFEENIVVLKLIEQTAGTGAGFSIENIKYSDENTLQIEYAKVDESITGPAAVVSCNIAAVSIPVDDFHADTIEWVLINS